ncbi:hypothetical protein ACFL0M_14070, partial [Thermodesulfobacteriota bacterium]
MKKLCWGFIKVGILIFIILSSGLAVYIHYKEKDFDPIREIQRLRIKKRRDDALDLARFLRDNRIGDVKRLEKLEKDLAYTIPEKVKSITYNGVIKGEVYDSYSGLGAIAADLFVIGDIRDLGIQSWKYLTNDPGYDKLVMLLSAAGIGLSSTSFVNGSASLAKNTIKYLKRVPGLANRGILKKFLSGKISPQNSKKIWNLLKKTAGPYQGPSVAYQT